jgi:hypothetical protein
MKKKQNNSKEISKTKNNLIDDKEVKTEYKDTFGLSEKSAELEKKELEKKYSSQKKSIKTKKQELKAVLEKKIPEAKKDLKEKLLEDPNFEKKETIKEYKKYLSEIEKNTKAEFKNLSEKETQLELDYEDLKTDPSIPMCDDYVKVLNHSMAINAPLMKMMFDYFNFLKDNKDVQDKVGIVIDHFSNDHGLFTDCFPQNPNMNYYCGNVMVMFKSKIRIIITLKKYYEDGKFKHLISFISEGKCDLNPDYVSKKILFNAISNSKIKGSYITLPFDSIMWQKENLEIRGFKDIFLPESIMNDLLLYTTLFDKTGVLLRYLMIGSPGTGKTESTLAIANYLKENKVTIIKTMVCPSLKEKIELAELLAPSLVIFDDIDLSLGSRSKGGVSSGLAQFLDVLDGTEKIRKDVGIIATTNSIQLLDMAAQRPGRFDKLLSFDSLTLTNIKDIILKSLNRNFDLEEKSISTQPFIHPSVIQKFYNSKVTGSHVYNSVKMLMLRIETLELKNVTPTWIVEEITNEIETIKRIRKTEFLTDTMSSREEKAIGFSTIEGDLPFVEEEKVTEEIDYKKGQEPNIR